MPAFRADRLITLGLFHSASPALKYFRARRIPILMYHGIGEDRLAGGAYFETNTSAATFAAQMQFLQDQGYQTTSLAELPKRITSDSNKKWVVITFDDAYRDFYTTAWPILSEHGLSATVFVVSDFPTKVSARFANKQFMTWEQIKEADSHGIEIGSHTVSHPQLWTLSKPDLTHELKYSKETIEEKLGKRIDSFSHPFAFPENDKQYCALFKSLLQEHGYESGVSTIVGTVGESYSRYSLPRLPVNDHDDLALFRAKLEGAYDWLHPVQLAYKSLKPMVKSVRPRRSAQHA